MSKRRDALDAADPTHPDHRKPVWDGGDVAKFCGASRWGVREWTLAGVLPSADEFTGEHRVRRLYIPAAVIAATIPTRRPVRPGERPPPAVVRGDSGTAGQDRLGDAVLPPLTAGSPVLFRLPNGTLYESRGSFAVAVTGRNGKPGGMSLVFDLGPVMKSADVTIRTAG